MSLIFQEGFLMDDFFTHNKEAVEEMLLTEAVNVRGKIDEILEIGNIDLLNNAHKLIIYIVNEQEDDLVAFARQEGRVWATHSLTLAFKLEWVQAIRRTIWTFLKNFEEFKHLSPSSERFFVLEKKVNDMVDQFLNTFFISYSDYKDNLLNAQRELVENLSVPIIPINKDICILPLIGTIDASRTRIIEEKVLTEIGRLRMQHLIIDLSGIADMEVVVISELLKIIDGTSMMGCDTVITGIRPEIVREMIRLGLSFENKAQTMGTLQQALNNFLSMKEPGY